MVTHDDAPATKKDVQMLMEQMGKLYMQTDEKLNGMREEMIQWKQEIADHFDLALENIRHDLLYGALSDKVTQHEDRIFILEKNAGFRR
jgi:hypothetical protein